MHARMTIRRGVTTAFVVCALSATGTGIATAATPNDWNAVAECESGGDWTINTGNGFFGGLQFTQESWAAAGGTQFAPSAEQATIEQQIAAGEVLLDQQGPGAWPVCGKALDPDAPGVTPVQAPADDPADTPAPAAGDAPAPVVTDTTDTSAADTPAEAPDAPAVSGSKTQQGSRRGQSWSLDAGAPWGQNGVPTTDAQTDTSRADAPQDDQADQADQADQDGQDGPAAQGSQAGQDNQDRQPRTTGPGQNGSQTRASGRAAWEASRRWNQMNAAATRQTGQGIDAPGEATLRDRQQNTGQQPDGGTPTRQPSQRQQAPSRSAAQDDQATPDGDAPSAPRRTGGQGSQPTADTPTGNAGDQDSQDSGNTTAPNSEDQNSSGQDQNAPSTGNQDTETPQNSGTNDSTEATAPEQAPDQADSEQTPADAPTAETPTDAPAAPAALRTATIDNTAGNTNPRAQAAADNIISTVPGAENITLGGTRDSAVDPTGHPSGNAVDYIVGDDKALGDAIVDHAIANWDELGINYIIWQQSILTDPNGQFQPMEDRGSPTANHKDHVHLQTLP